MTKNNPRRRRILRRILLAASIILLILIARPVGFLTYTYFTDKKQQSIQKEGYVNDASRLNETKVEIIWSIPPDTAVALSHMAELVRQAAATGKKISITGASHSMGGHTIYEDAIVLNMKGLNYMQYDSINNILLVGAGARWGEVVLYLDGYGKSVGVMQSNNSFSVGGSISVNCHGWQPESPPIASTVQSFRLLTADGNILQCSRTENSKLFSLVLGGYGLFGVIIDVKLRPVDNKSYKAYQHVIKSKDYIDQFTKLVKNDATVGMAYGRISINPDNFMEEAILSVYKTDPSAPAPAKENGFAGLRRTVFRGSANSAYGKNLRWRMEKMGAWMIDGKKFSRNQLLNESVEVYQNADTGYTDILHEYFIPTRSVDRFIDSLKTVLPTYKVDLLNITVRNVLKDDDTFLNYAREEVFGFVMLFNQSRTDAAENEMRLLTQQLIDIAVAMEGTYYLPYRLHATREQMHRTYPQAKEFFSLKKQFDPQEIFRNKFYETYK